MSNETTARDVTLGVVVGTLPEDYAPRTVLLDFRGESIDHLKLTPEEALELAEGLVVAARDAGAKRTTIVMPSGIRPR